MIARFGMAALLFAASVALPVQAQVQRFETRSFIICKGENKPTCKPHDVHIGCSQSETPVIEQACTVTAQGGQTRVREYTKEKISEEGGHQCGYTRWRVQCAAE